MNSSLTNLKTFIQKATSPYHVVEESKKILLDNGFTELPPSQSWNLKQGGRYFIVPFDTTLYAFTVGNTLSKTPAFRIATAHTDHPCFRLKPVCELKEHSYLKLNTETYGGPILNTWLDRPLSIAGKVCLKSSDVMHPETVLFDARKPLVTIPNLAIHMNRQINKGVELNKQTDINPIIGLLNNKLNQEHFLLNYLASELNTTPENILACDLMVYNCEEPVLLGMDNDFFSSPRLDNLTSVVACLNGMIHDTNEKDIHMIALYDNEEIGSRTKQGADSILTNLVLENILDSFQIPKKSLFQSLPDSMILSADVAHGLHPNFPGKSDPVTVCELGKGVVFKLDSNHKYAFDSEAISILQRICETNNIAYQKFANRSDMPSGSTLGSIISSWLPMKSIDIGVPLLAMHSARELMAAKDQSSLERTILSFFLA